MKRNNFTNFMPIILIFLFTQSVESISPWKLQKGYSDNDWLKELLEQFKDIIKHGKPTMDIPVLDPFFISENFIFNSEISSCVFIEGYLYNYSDYSVQEAKFSKDMVTNLNISFERPLFKGKFMINGTAYKIIPLGSRGIIGLEFKNIDVYFGAKFLAKNKMVQINDFSFNYNLENIKLDVEGLWNEFEGIQYILRDVLFDITPHVLSKFKRKIINKINNTVLTTGNFHLKQVNLRTVIEMLKYKLDHNLFI